MWAPIPFVEKQEQRERSQFSTEERKRACSPMQLNSRARNKHAMRSFTTFIFSVLVTERVPLTTKKRAAKVLASVRTLKVLPTLNWLNLTIMQENTEKKMRSEKNKTVQWERELTFLQRQGSKKGSWKKGNGNPDIYFSDRIYPLLFFSRLSLHNSSTCVNMTRRVSTFVHCRTINATKRFIHGQKGS